MMSRVTVDLSPQLVECLVRLEKMVGDTNKVELISDALFLYEEILKRALSGKKIRLADCAPPAQTRNNIFQLNPVEEDSASRRDRLFKDLDERMRLAAEVGLIPQR